MRLEGLAGGVVAASLRRLADVARQTVPPDLAAWAAQCGSEAGFPLLGTSVRAEPYVALQWNGERCLRAGLAGEDLVALTGVVTAWLHDRSVGDLQAAVTRALGELPGGTGAATAGVPVTAEVVRTAVCAALLSGVREAELPELIDLAGTLLQVRPRIAGATQGAGSAAGHTAAAGWLASQVHLAGLTAYPGALTDTLATATLPPDGPALATPVRQLVEGLT